MKRATVKIEGVDRPMTFDFPQTVARDEVLQKIFSLNKSWKETLPDPTGNSIYPTVFITWSDPDAPIDMGQDGIKGPTDASPSEPPADAGDQPVETPAG